MAHSGGAYATRSRRVGNLLGALPDDILQHVLLMLSLPEMAAVACVCRSWAALCTRAWSAVTHIDAGELNCTNGARCNDATLRRLFARCANVCSVNMSGRITLVDATALMLSVHCHRLHSVSFAHCVAITSATVRSLLLAAPYLQSLNLFGCHRVCRQAFTQLAEQLEQPLDLREAVLSWTNVAPEGVEALTALAPRLCRLFISTGRSLFWDRGRGAMRSLKTCCSLSCGKADFNFQMCADCRSFTYCTVSCQRDDWMGTHKDTCPLQRAFGTNLLSSISSHICQQLSVLDLCGNFRLPVASLISFLRQATNLRELSLSRCGLTDISFFQQFVGMPFVRHLRIFDCRENRMRDQTVKIVMEHCTSLEELYITGARVSDEGVSYIAFSPHAQRHLRSFLIRSTRVSLEAVQNLMEHCPRLLNLVVLNRRHPFSFVKEEGSQLAFLLGDAASTH